MDSKNIINDNNIQKEKKEIKSTFMPKIKRKTIAQLFNKKLSSNLTKYLFNFFSYKDLYEFGKIDLFLMNNIIEYFEQNEPWPEKVRKLKSKYNFKIYQDEVDQTLNDAKINKRRYKFPSENNVNYYQYDIDGDKYISIAKTFSWTHKDNPQYWTEKKIKGSYEPNEKVPYLITVCWLDTYFTFFHVKPNNYKLFINEHFSKKKNFKKRVSLKVYIEDKIIYEEKKFPSKELFNNNSGVKENLRLNEDFICFIKKEDFESIINEKKLDINGKVKVEFFHADDYWKDGWYIDGGCLKEITQKEMDKEIEEMNKRKEENEKKKLFGKEEDEKSDDINYGFYDYSGDDDEENEGGNDGSDRASVDDAFDADNPFLENDKNNKNNENNENK